MERRGFFRKQVDLPGELILSSGTRLLIRVRDVSAGGMQIQCDAFDGEVIAPNGNFLDRFGRPVEMDLVFAPASGKALVMHCRVVFVRRVSWDEFRIGLRYTDMLQPELAELRDFIQGDHR